MALKDKPRVDFTLRGIEQRAAEKDGKKIITGFIPYNSRSVDFGWGFYEIMNPGCFKKTIKDKTEVRAFHNHDDSKVLGNTKSGTLSLTDTAEGLEVECELPNTSYANDLYEVIKRGDCRTMSFGMYVVKCEYEDKADGTTIRTITEAALDEVSFGVAYPAYPETNSGAEERGLKALKVSEMTESMKNKVLSLAEEIRSATETDKGQQSPDTGAEQGEATPQNDSGATDPNAEEEAKRKAEEEAIAQANAEADAFLFSQAL